MNKRLLYIFIGLSIFSFIIYNRIFRIRLPRELYIFPPFTNDVRWFFLFIVILWIFICIFIIYKSFLAFLEKEEKKTIFSSYSEIFALFINESIKEGYYFFRDIIGKYFYNNLYDIFSNFAPKYYNIMQILPKNSLLFISYFIRFLIVFMFLIDVFIFFKFNYFYKSLFLLLIPLFIKIIHYLLKDIAQENYNEYKDILGIKEKGINNRGEQLYSFNIKEDFSNLANQMDYFFNEFILCHNILVFLDSYDEAANFYNLRKNLIVYSLFLTGWSYILFKNLYLLI